MTASSASASALTGGSTSLDGDVGLSSASAASLAQVPAPSTAPSATPEVAADATPAPTPSPAPTPAPTPSSSPTPAPGSGWGDKGSHGPPSGGGDFGGGSDCRSGKGSSGSKESPEAELERRRTTGSCSFYPSKFKECAEPRSCYDCLNFVVKDEEGGCMVSEYGRCVPARQYNSALDFSRFPAANANSTGANRTGSGSAGGSLGASVGDVGSKARGAETWYQFRADAAQYCERSDALCKECRRSVFADYIENETRRGGARFCLGTGGCVCIAACEARSNRPPPNNKDCFAKALAATNKDKSAAAGDGGMGSVFAILGAMMFVVVTVFAIYRMRSHSERRRSRSGSSSSSSPSSGAGAQAGEGRAPATAAGHASALATPESGASPSHTVLVTVTSTTAAAGSRLLNLFGWHAMRDDLISKEHERFEEASKPASPLKHADVAFLGVEPSAPEIDADVPAVPMAAMAIPVATVVPSAPMVFSVRATASAPDFEDMDDEYEVL